MIWIFRKLRWSGTVKSKIFITSLAFFFGYLFNLLIPLSKVSETEFVYDEYSSQVIKLKEADVFLVILIFSTASNFNKRQILRDTWLSDLPGKKVKYLFVISLGNVKDDTTGLVREEQTKYQDSLIFPNLEDSFYTLTPKLIASFGWLTGLPVLDMQGKSDTKKQFKSFEFVLKCDDDSYVRVDEVVEELKTFHSVNNNPNLYWGFFDGRAKVKKSGKYKEDEWDICDFYIPYALGGGYVLAQPLVEYIAKNGNHLKQYKSEDVSVGAWLATYSGVNRVHDTRFDTEYISRGCHNSYLITHKHSETAIRNFYNNLKNLKQLCQKEFKTRMSYVYNWDVVPSKCCARVNPNIP